MREIERKRERKREMDKQTFIHYFIIFSEIIHSVSLILRDIWLPCYWSSSSVHFWFWSWFDPWFFFFLQKCVFSLDGGGVLQNGIKHTQWNRKETPALMRCFIWYSHKLCFATDTKGGVFLTWCAYLLAGICSHGPRLSSWTRVYWQREEAN